MIKKHLKIIIICSVIIFSLALFLILFYNIPRITYKYNEKTETYYVNKVYGNKSIYEIEEEYKGVLVTGISARAFYQKDLVEVILPKSINHIERLAFSECKYLENINLENVIEIERNAFSYCDSLKEIDIYAKYIGASAFYKCINLENINLHEGLISIGSMAFSYTIIEDINIPKSTKEIYDKCFIYCNNLKNINVYGNTLLDNEYLKGLNIVNYIGG